MSKVNDLNEKISTLYENTSTSNITSKVGNLYESMGKKYFDKYGGSVFITFIMIILIISIISYLNIKTNLIHIKENWNDLKCNPKYAPFAGMVVPEDGKDFFQIGTENATYCFNRILKEVSAETLLPYQAIINIFGQLTGNIMNVGNDIRNLSNTMREHLKDTFEDQYNRIINSIVPIQKMFITIKDIMAKTKGAMITSIYPMLGLYYTLKSTINGVYNLIVKILVGLTATIVVLWIFPFTWGAAASMSAIFMLIMVPMVILSTMMGEVFHLSPRGLPKRPKHRRHCFNGNYKISTKRGMIPICDLIPGDKIGNHKVTSVMKLTSENEIMYYLGNGLYVSGNHKIYNPLLKDFIDVSMDCRFKPSKNFKDNYIYCFNTSNKTIRIDDHLFLDYDEMTNDDISKIIYEYKNFFPNNNFKLSNINKVFDGGFYPSTQIKLIDGTIKSMLKIDIGDVLEDGNKIEGKVYIDNTIGLFNVFIDKNKQLNNINPNIIYFENETKKSTILLKKQPVKSTLSYNIHLLTTKGYFNIYNIKVGDYNTCLDFFIEKNKDC